MRQRQSLQEIRLRQFGVAYDGWEAGWRPFFLAQEERREGRLCVSVQADQCLPSIRRRLHAHGFTTAWGQLCGTFPVQRRLTARNMCKDGRTQRLGKAIRPEPDLVRLYPAPVSPLVRGARKLVVRIVTISASVVPLGENSRRNESILK